MNKISESIDEQLEQSHKVYTEQFIRLEAENKYLKNQIKQIQDKFLMDKFVVSLKAEYELMIKDLKGEIFGLKAINNIYEEQLKVANNKLNKLKARILCENADEFLEYLMDIIDSKEDRNDKI